MSFNPLNYTICFDKPRRLTDLIPWHEHIPFAFAVVQILKPKILVELGTHKGDSYCAFCQAVMSLEIDTACYAVDIWEGDKQAGFYGTEIFEELKSYHDPLYGSFSQLIKSRFDQALDYFSDGSIDLLHIDGLHTYEAVEHDFKTWLPKISQRGVVIFHDINVRENDFGVWRLWEEVKNQYPSFEFKHGHGLGVLAIGCEPPTELLTLLEKQNSISISNFFAYLGNKITLQDKISELDSVLQTLTAHVAVQVTENERLTQLYTAQVTENERLTQLYTAQVTENERLTQLYTAQVTENERLTQLYTAQATENDRFTRLYSAQVAENDRFTRLYSTQAAEKENRIHSLEVLIDSIYQSVSWKITQPARGVHTVLQKILTYARSIVWRIGTLIYRTLPVSTEKKQRLKETLFRYFGFLSGMKHDQSVPSAATPPNYNGSTETLMCLNQDSESKKMSSCPQIRVTDRKKISVIITSYNHERYIRQCLDSILIQKGNFNLEIIIGDDCSTDKTGKTVQQYYEIYPDTIKIMPKEDNLGITKNLKRCLDASVGDYIAICEGDDYWTDEYKLQRQMELLEGHKDYSMCFSSFMIFYEDKNIYAPFGYQNSLNKDVITTEDLIQKNYIGNFSCCMYRTGVVRKLKKEIFDVYTVDWMFNMACGEIGKIGFIRDCMSVYRKHSKGAWSGKPISEQIETLLLLTDIYDKLLDYKYKNQFEKYKTVIISEASFQKDLLILDTIFPLPISPFRYQEFMSYFDHFPSSLVLTTGEHFPALNEKRSVGEVIGEFEREYPKLTGRTIVASHDVEPYNAKLAYVIFLDNMRIFLETLEKKRIPFIFTLYPGGGFQLNKSSTDDSLTKIFNSPQFRKVIVTQKITYDYLISKNFCNPTQIEFIYGVVTPLESIKKYDGKKYFGFEKNTLDICFVSHKYMAKGIDKGYDVFIKVAKKLAKIHDNIHYHVVGNFTNVDISIRGLEGRITFYGLQKKEWFDIFYMDKDIILSPNIPFILLDGAFDGFPTASCTEAGLRNVAILCTDILRLNAKFTDWEDIVIIPHDSDKIVDTINHLYSDPAKLKKIAENGSAKIRHIYSYDNQIAPRIRILEQELKKK